MLKKFLAKPIIIFGSSREGRLTQEILNRYNITPLCYIDNHKDKIGVILNDVEIKSVDYIKTIDDYIILIPSLYYKDMYKQLMDMKISKSNIANIDIYYKPLMLFDIPYKIKFYFFMHKYFLKHK